MAFDISDTEAAQELREQGIDPDALVARVLGALDRVVLDLHASILLWQAGALDPGDHADISARIAAASARHNVPISDFKSMDPTRVIRLLANS